MPDRPPLSSRLALAKLTPDRVEEMHDLLDRHPGRPTQWIAAAFSLKTGRSLSTAAVARRRVERAKGGGS
jgi:hypothetical protein